MKNGIGVEPTDCGIYLFIYYYCDNIWGYATWKKIDRLIVSGKVGYSVKQSCHCLPQETISKFCFEELNKIKKNLLRNCFTHYEANRERLRKINLSIMPYRIVEFEGKNETMFEILH
jgi:hypothetical protein